ncbi:MAG: cytidine deaminase [Jatrophihabitans sp.]
MNGTPFDAEDAKLVTLARATRARTGAGQGAAVRDTDGRTYAAASVELTSLRLSALQVAVAMALSAGAPGLEAAVVFAGDPADPDGLAAVAELSRAAPVYFVDERGQQV